MRTTSPHRTTTPSKNYVRQPAIRNFLLRVSRVASGCRSPRFLRTQSFGKLERRAELEFDLYRGAAGWSSEKLQAREERLNETHSKRRLYTPRAGESAGELIQARNCRRPATRAQFFHNIV